MPTFSVSEIATDDQAIGTYCASLQTALYEQYKEGYKLSVSTDYRGQAADAYKNYIITVSLYLLKQLINAVDELKLTSASLKGFFEEVESASNGIIDTATLTDEYTRLIGQESEYNTLISTVTALNATALANGAEVCAYDTTPANDTYTALRLGLDDIETQLTAANTSAGNVVELLLARIQNLKKQISTILSDYHTPEGTIDYAKLPTLTAQDWYQDEGCPALVDMMMNDPFLGGDPVAGALAEDLWVFDGGYQLVSAAGGEARFFASADELEAYLRFHAIDYQIEGENFVIGGSFGMTALAAGAGVHIDKYGLRADANAVFLSGKASVTLLPTTLHLQGQANGSLLNADAYIIAEAQDINTFTFGAGASAKVAEGNVGVSVGQVQTNRGESPVLGISVGADVGSIGGDLSISSANWIDTDFIDVNIVTINIGASLGIGFEGTLTFPFPNLFGWLN